MIVLFFLDMRNLQEQVKKAFCYQSQKNVKFSAFSLEFQKSFSITRTIYSNSERSEQFLVTEGFLNLFLENRSKELEQL